MKPTRETVEGRAYLDLQNQARRDKRPTDELLTLYALEGFLARLDSSPQANLLVLKGGVLLAAFAARRPTRDVDLHAHHVNNDVESVLVLIRSIDAFERRGIGRTKPLILDQTRDDLYPIDIVPLCQRHRSTQNVCDMSTGVFGQPEFDRRPLQATAQRYRQDIQRAIPLTDHKPMIGSRGERSQSARSFAGPCEI